MRNGKNDPKQFIRRRTGHVRLDRRADRIRAILGGGGLDGGNIGEFCQVCICDRIHIFSGFERSSST